MTTDSLAELARAWAERTCAAQGVPVKVTAAETLAVVGKLLGPAPQACLRPTGRAGTGRGDRA